MINIDSEKCIGCLKCVSVCPFNVLDTENGKPVMRGEKLCIKCLHCAAACAQDAIRLDDLNGILPEDLPELGDDFPAELEGYLLARRSYRHFKPEQVPKDTIGNALRISAWAPSAKNQHPTKWIVICEENMIKAIMDFILQYVRETGISPEIAQLYERGHNVVMGNAKTLILGYARTDAINPFVDTALALHNAELMLQARGIGTCWAGYLTRMCNQVPAIRETIGLPDGCQVFGSLMAGFPDREEYIHIPNRHKQPDIKWL
jgi:nitroreductase/NAD-dependent dihydropyrimidine dehydrogenase PreA subunit